MIPLLMDYATPSVFESTRDRALVGFAADARRPVRFHGKVTRHLLSVRLALQTLGELIWRSDEWLSAEERAFLLDPIATVHPDRVFFEALSADQSAYGLVILDRALFATEGEVQTGTTNIDFTAFLWAALAEMRSSRETFFRIGAEGFEVRTTGAGGRFERKVDVPDDWVRGFLQLQGAMALPGTRLTLRPVDLLAAIRFLRFTKAKVSPRAIRYELEPGRDAAMILEPWEQLIPLRGAEHSYAEKRVIRTWGRRRLNALEPLLPYADSVEVFLKGRALPSFYAVKLPGVTFVLGLSGWTSQRWTSGGSFDLLVAPERAGGLKKRVLEALRLAFVSGAKELARQLGADEGDVSRALNALCAEGRCIYDVESRRYRHRELFSPPIELESIYPPDPRREASERLIRGQQVEVLSAGTRETPKMKRLKTPEGPVFREIVHRDWVVQGRVGQQPTVELVLNDEDRLIFGHCGCDFFKEHLFNRGPCEHLLALLHVAQPQRKDATSSVAVDEASYDAAARSAMPTTTGAARSGAGNGEDEGAHDDEEEDDLDEEQENVDRKKRRDEDD